MDSSKFIDIHEYAWIFINLHGSLECTTSWNPGKDTSIEHPWNPWMSKDSMDSIHIQEIHTKSSLRYMHRNHIKVAAWYQLAQRQTIGSDWCWDSLSRWLSPFCPSFHLRVSESAADHSADSEIVMADLAFGDVFFKQNRLGTTRGQPFQTFRAPINIL